MKNNQLKHGSLFSGEGGFDLAAQWCGWDNAFHCEITPFCRHILKYYWPNAKLYKDIRDTDFTVLRGRIDVLSGGFPCQPYSVAGKRKGKDDDRHLWPEKLRAVREISPIWVVGENVRGLVNWNGGLVFDEVQADLEAEGYEVLPFILPAAGVEAPHRRERILFIAYSDSNDAERHGFRKTDRRRAKAKATGKNGNCFGMSLHEMMKRELLPTPTAISDSKGGCTRSDPKRQNGTLANAVHGMMGEPGKTSQLNPLFVAEMMGFPPDWTLRPFLKGSQSRSHDQNG